MVSRPSTRLHGIGVGVLGHREYGHLFWVWERRLESDCGPVHSRIRFRNCDIGLGCKEEVVDSSEHLGDDVVGPLLPLEHGGLALVLGNGIFLLQLC